MKYSELSNIAALDTEAMIDIIGGAAPANYGQLVSDTFASPALPHSDGHRGGLGHCDYIVDQGISFGEFIKTKPTDAPVPLVPGPGMSATVHVVNGT